MSRSMDQIGVANTRRDARDRAPTSDIVQTASVEEVIHWTALAGKVAQEPWRDMVKTTDTTNASLGPTCRHTVGDVHLDVHATSFTTIRQLSPP